MFGLCFFFMVQNLGFDVVLDFFIFVFEIGEKFVVSVSDGGDFCCCFFGYYEFLCWWGGVRMKWRQSKQRGLFGYLMGFLGY